MDTEEVKADGESVSKDRIEGIKDTPAEVQDEDKTVETPIDEAKSASDVEDNKNEASEEEEKTSEGGPEG